ncbi:MAG: RDD family protein [Burkholderiaceae bacterium]|nr:RDD family protein [Microbacteriaceae bacterium]
MSFANNPGPTSGASSQAWPGQRLGLPARGPRSIARPGRRFAALCIDWGIAYGVSYFFFGNEGLATSLIFAVFQTVMILFVSGGIGHLLLGMRVVPATGGRVGLWRPIVRSVLLTLVIPAAIWDKDQRGMHDRLAGTILVRV